MSRLSSIPTSISAATRYQPTLDTMRPPSAASYEQAILGGMLVFHVEDLREWIKVLPVEDFQFALYRAIYGRIKALVLKGDEFPITAVYEGIDPFLESDMDGVKPREILWHAMRIAPTDLAEAWLCIDRIRECAARRRRFEAALESARLSCDEGLLLSEIDVATNARFKAARGQVK